MTGYEKVFIDTAPFIYFLDENELFGDAVRKIFEEIINSEKTMISSVVTCEEYLVYPYKTDNQEKIDAFYEFTSDCGIELCPITNDIANKAAEIRAKYESFKSMDALQLAVATIRGCDVILTNDRQLCQYSELKCITIEDWSDGI